MTHLEPSGAPAAGRPPPQLEGEEDQEEGEERGLDQGKSACPSEACPLPEWGRCWESRAPSTDIFFQMRDRPAPTGLPSKPLLWTLGQPSSHPLKAPS